MAAVREILADVRARGDDAVRELTERFDGVRLDDLRVPTADLAAALARIAAPVRDALGVAASAIADFPRERTASAADATSVMVSWYGRCPCPSTGPGATCRAGARCIPSTVLMTAIPARVAGVDEVVLCVPPDRETGRVPDVDARGRRDRGGRRGVRDRRRSGHRRDGVRHRVDRGRRRDRRARQHLRRARPSARSPAKAWWAMPVGVRGSVRGRGGRRRHHARSSTRPSTSSSRPSTARDGLAWLITWSERGRGPDQRRR